MMGSLTRNPRPEFWRVLLHLPSAATALPIFLFMICSGEAGEGREECSLVKNGRLDECTVLINKTFYYTDQELYESCRQSKLQEGPQCLRHVLEECEKLGDVDPAQIRQLQNTTLVWQRKFHSMCAQIVELHHSASAASHSPNSGQVCGPEVRLKEVALFIVALWSFGRI